MTQAELLEYMRVNNITAVQAALRLLNEKRQPILTKVKSLTTNWFNKFTAFNRK